MLKAGMLAAIGASGCMPPTLRRTRDAINSQIAGVGAGSYGVSQEFLKRFRYATMGVRLHGDIQFIGVLATIERNRYTWATADSKIFVTEGGRLIQTRGFDRDLSAVRWLAPDPLLDWQRLRAESKRGVYREVELTSGSDRETGLPIESRFAVLGNETITVLGEERSTVKVREIATIGKWRWAAENTFWIDVAQPVVWRSNQAYCPEVGSIQLELLKKPV